MLYFDRLSESEWNYWEKQRPFIVKEITRQTGLVPELRKEGIAMVDPQGKLTDYGLPEEGTDGHLTLLIAEFLAKRLRKKPDTRIPLAALYAHTAELIREHKKHWRKNVTEPGMEIVGNVETNPAELDEFQRSPSVFRSYRRHRTSLCWLRCH